MNYINKVFIWDFNALKNFYETYVLGWIKGTVGWTAAQKKQARANLGFGDGDIDSEPTARSQNLVKSGGVYNEVQPTIISGTTENTWANIWVDRNNPIPAGSIIENDGDLDVNVYDTVSTSEGSYNYVLIPANSSLTCKWDVYRINTTNVVGSYHLKVHENGTLGCRVTDLSYNVKRELVYLGADNHLINGGIDNNNGHIIRSSTRAVTYYFSQAPIKIETSGNIQFRRVEYTLGGNFIDIVANWVQTMEISDTSKLYRFVFKNEDDTHIDASDVEALLNISSGCKYLTQEFAALSSLCADHETRINVVEEDKITYIAKQSANIHNNATPTSSTDPEPTDGSDWVGHNISRYSGDTVVSADYNVSYYIGIDSSSSYKCTRALRRLCWYDINKSWISPSIESIEANSEIVPPTGAHFCRFMYNNTKGLTPDDVRFGEYNQNIDVPYEGGYILKDKYNHTILTEDDISDIEGEISDIKDVIEQLGGEKKILTVVGSSGLARDSGGQYQLTEAQKEAYGVSTDLVMGKVMQVLLGYDEINVCADSGYTASTEVFRCGLVHYILKNSITLPADGSSVQYEWNTNTIGSTITKNLNVLSPSKIGEFTGYIKGVKVNVDATNGTIALAESQDADYIISANSLISRTPVIRELNSNGVVRKAVAGSTGLILQIGANSEGATPNEILDYCELLIRASGCKWFVCLPKNGTGVNSDPTNDLNAAVPLLKEKYGSMFIDHRPYMCSLEALADQQITPTTSDTYPDVNGQNSNPLSATQIANGVKCDMQCITEGLYPSSFWHSAYRDGELQEINSSHFNAQGLECWGKFMVKAISKIQWFDDTIPINTTADKVTNATSGNLAGLDGNGNLTDSNVAANQVVVSTTVRTIVTLTQAQYDALATKDANTEYNIIEP